MDAQCKERERGRQDVWCKLESKEMCNYVESDTIIELGCSQSEI